MCVYAIKAENLFDISPILVAFRLFLSVPFLQWGKTTHTCHEYTHTERERKRMSTIWLLHCKMRLILFKISCKIEYIISKGKSFRFFEGSGWYCVLFEFGYILKRRFWLKSHEKPNVNDVLEFLRTDVTPASYVHLPKCLFPITI